MSKDTSKTKSKENIKGALIGAGVTVLIAIATGIFLFGSFNEKINNLSSKLSEIEINNKTLSSSLTLTNNILTRILNHVNISEIEKIAIYGEISKTIKGFSNSATFITTGQSKSTINLDSQEQIKASEPEYMKGLKEWGQNIKPSPKKATQ